MRMALRINGSLSGVAIEPDTSSRNTRLRDAISRSGISRP